MASKLLIILSIFLSQSCGNLITIDKFGLKSFLGRKSVITDINDKWLVNFVRTIDNKCESCQAMPIRRRVFIADAECINRSLVNHHILLSRLDEIFEYGLCTRQKPVLADDRRTLIRGIAQMAYEEVLGYNEANQTKKLSQNITDTNYAKCFMATFKGKRIGVPCYTLNDTSTSCMYSLTASDYTFSQYNNLLNYLICHTKRSKEKVVLGVLSGSNKPSISLHDQVVPLEFENIDDLDTNIRRKLHQWFDDNPYRRIYPLY
ncbi:hypothetical protein KQX54_017045 [Cotesia glomerata]|uniref:Uncharacterized protein n=1 Tax=Cotesia glomerata TaxID=32391 RepID=A0AAV7IYN8_COTGL|nr:hypothetical protein KQX54_017045 [Cotesia glomerata]